MQDFVDTKVIFMIYNCTKKAKIAPLVDET